MLGIVDYGGEDTGKGDDGVACDAVALIMNFRFQRHVTRKFQVVQIGCHNPRHELAHRHGDMAETVK